MAAGMGNRYGGLKQLEPIGPAGETLIEYAVFDAIRAGFGKLVFVIRREFEVPFRTAIASRFDQRIPVVYVYQEIGDVPPGWSVESTRKKPWGTGHAILQGATAIAESFAAINADDFYGQDSFHVIADHLRTGGPDYALVGYVLRNTLSDFGTVTRGICEVRSDGFLGKITEIQNIARDGDGATFASPRRTAGRLTGDEIVSMSMWGFTPRVFAQLHERWVAFVGDHNADENAELLIPTVVGGLVDNSEARCKVLRTTGSWLGVTYQDDRPAVVDGIRRLINRGEYPAALWA